jgi:RNA-directed DNA polymerase
MRVLAPPPVKAVPIPKKAGGVRVLGVPTVADRVAQTIVKLFLEPKLDPLFHAEHAGFQAGGGAALSGEGKLSPWGGW